MIELLQTLGAFVLALGILITAHEYGHYRVAKQLGVRILRFSVGFGRPLLRWSVGRDRTEFVLASVPLGGYVKMLDEREGEVAPAESHRAFNRQPVQVRTAIVAAGPLANLLLAVMLYWAMFMAGVSGPRPILGEVTANSPAAVAGLRAGDEISAVNGEPVAIWDNFLASAVGAVLEGAPLSLAVAQPGATPREITLDLGAVALDDLTRGGFFEKVGFRPLRPSLRPEIGRVVAGEPAADAGLRAGDLLLEADGRPLDDWVVWVELVRASPGRSLEVVVLRNNTQHRLTVVPGVANDEGRRIGRIGAEVASPSAPSPEIPQGIERYGPWRALEKASERTWEMSRNTLSFLRQMVIGRASMENLSGPISIAQYAGESARLGPSRFLEFLGLVSVSLAVLNLLPIPMLDGGHLIFYLIESAARRPVPEAIQGYGQQVGLVLLLGLMGLALYNDLMRVFSS